jgi:hypothetical protein
VAVDLSPAQSVGYPDCPYHAAWKPCRPDGRLAGGGMPGPTPDVQDAAGSDARAKCADATRSAVLPQRIAASKRPFIARARD